ncbi:MAG TPA: DUF4214 domain-containing protein [Gemmataceae bacterium]|nr:DUF4214 domain-containing protein [Gemmataceae bacterium]
MTRRKSATRVRPQHNKPLAVEPLEDRTLLTAGFLDPTFGSSGKVLTPFGTTDDEATSSLIQADGKIVVGGFTTTASGQDFALARYNSNGSLDSSFGTGGKVTADFFGGNDEILGVAEQPDGRIVAAGFATTAGGEVEFALARFLANGTLDSSFGNGGKVETAIGGNVDEATAVKLQSDGAIVVAGFSTQTPNGNLFAVARYDVNGNLDPSFGTGGIVTTNFGLASLDRANALLIQPDSKIVAVGSSNQGASTVFALARFDAQGKLDTTFGAGGKVTTSLAGQDDEAFSVALQSDNKLIVAGSTKIGGFLDFAVVRYATDGKVDTAFGTGGKAATDFAGKDDRALAVVVQPDGKIVAAGSATEGGNIDMALARYTPTGTLDGTFGTNGTAVTDLGGGFASINALFLASDRTFTAAGSAVSGVTRQFVLTRYLGDPVQAGQLDTTFGSSGQVHFQFGKNTEKDALNDAVLQADGRLIAVGSTTAATGAQDQFGVARFNTDGSPDTSFGSGGGAITGFGNSNDGVAHGVAIQADGKIVVAGSYANGQHIALARYNMDGSIDLSFGNQGKVTTNFTASEFANSVVVEPNGKILVAGSGKTPANNSGFLLARFNPDGNVDASFGLGGGFITTDLGPSDAAANRIILQADGSIIAVGHTSTSASNFHFAVLRYDSSGNLDQTFNGTGEVLINFPEGGPTPLGADARGVSLQLDGKIVVAGNFIGQDGLSELVIARLNSDGTPDPSFNGSGHVVFHGLQDVTANDVAIQSNGKIVAAGAEGRIVAANTTPADANFFLQRYNPNGTLDPTFGSNGTVITDVAPNDGDVANRLLVQTDNKLVAAGTAGGDKLRRFGLVRYVADTVGPQADAGGTYTVVEGGKVQLDGSGSTETGQPGATLAYAWDLNGNGMYGETGTTHGDETTATPTFIATGLDAPLAYKVRLQVTDQKGLTNYATATILITEAKPTVSISGAASVNEGTPYSLNLSAIDPGPDPFTGWTINWGDGTVQTVSGNPSAVMHTFLTESAGVTVSASATNSDGTFAAGNNVTVAVNLVPPTVAISGNNIADEGETYTLSLSSQEPGGDTITNWTINWGDGTHDNIPGSATTATHVFAKVTANYTVSAIATDEDGNYNTNTITVAVSNQPLVLTIVGANFTIPGQVYTLQPTSNKPITNMISSWTINWGDGIVQTFVGNPSAVTHTYAAISGAYTISASAQDPTGTHAASNTITVNASFPSANQNFVAQLYHDLLNRPVETFGLASWSGFLSAGGSRSAVVQGIEASQEYRTEVIDNLYETILGRVADKGGLAAFLEMTQIGGTIEQVKAALMGSQEFFARTGGNNDAFVEAVYKNALGRNADADGKINWLNRLSQGATRQQVADLILRSEEATDVLVGKLYQQFLHRPADDAGLQGWVTDILNGMSAELIAAFIAGSQEYFNRF